MYYHPRKDEKGMTFEYSLPINKYRARWMKWSRLNLIKGNVICCVKNMVECRKIEKGGNGLIELQLKCKNAGAGSTRNAFMLHWYLY